METRSKTRNGKKPSPKKEAAPAVPTFVARPAPPTTIFPFMLYTEKPKAIRMRPFRLCTYERANKTGKLKKMTHEKLEKMAQLALQREQEIAVLEKAAWRQKTNFKASGIPPYLRRMAKRKVLEEIENQHVEADGTQGPPAKKRKKERN